MAPKTGDYILLNYYYYTIFFLHTILDYTIFYCFQKGACAKAPGFPKVEVLRHLEDPASQGVQSLGFRV